MIIGVSLLVLSWHGIGTRHSYIRSESQLAVNQGLMCCRWSFGQEGFSLHNKCVRSKFLTVLSCQLFDIVYISVSWLMSGASNSTPVLFEDCEIWHVTMVTKNEVLFLNFCLRILLRQVPSERDLSQQPAYLS